VSALEETYFFPSPSFTQGIRPIKAYLLLQATENASTCAPAWHDRLGYIAVSAERGQLSRTG